MGAMLNASMTFYGLPWGKKSFDRMIAEVAASSADIGLKERNFNDSFEGVMLYVTEIDMKTRTLIDVFIEDQRTPHMSSTVVAPKGRLFSDPEKKMFQLRLFDGLVNQVSLKNHSAHTLKFDTYEINLDLKKSEAERRSKTDDEQAMWFSELRGHIDQMPVRNENYYEALVELHKKFSMPFACLVLGFLAFPLGLRSRGAKRSLGLGLGLLFFLMFYLVLSAGKMYGEAGEVPPSIGMWVPNVAVALLGVFFFKRAAGERPFQFSFLPPGLRKLVLRRRYGP
jgi:lipopolysaccharide export system permease protein